MILFARTILTGLHHLNLNSAEQAVSRKRKLAPRERGKRAPSSEHSTQYELV
jgi:hypothetical protein